MTVEGRPQGCRRDKWILCCGSALSRMDMPGGWLQTVQRHVCLMLSGKSTIKPVYVRADR